MATIPPFVAVVPKTVETTEQVELGLRQLCLVFGSTDQPAQLIILLGAQDANGAWRQDVNPPSVVITDDPANPDPAQRTHASDAHDAILNATLGDTPLAQALGVVGQPVLIGGRAILAALAGITPVALG